MALHPAWRAFCNVGWVAKPLAPAPLARAMCEALGIEAPERVRVRERTATASAGAGRSLAVLLAEDNAMNQKLATTLLDRLGHRIEVADDGRAAVAMALAGDYDVILMDLQMPEVDGLEATRQIVAALGDRRPVIVALTANAMSGDREACIAAGMDDYLSKPLRRGELTAVLDAIAAHNVDRRVEDLAVLDLVGTQVPSPSSSAGNPIREALRRRVTELVGAEDADFEQELIDTFLADLPRLVQAIEDGRTSGDLEAVRRAAHTLKSQVSVFGADDLAEACRVVEASTATGQAADPQIEAVLDGTEVLAAHVRALNVEAQ